MANFVPFHSFSDEEVALDFAEKLNDIGIAFELEKASAMLDSVIIGTSSIPNIAIRLRQADFETAHAALEDYYGKQAESITRDYHLFSFTDEELFEIIEKPDDWGYLDQHLAKKILKERGITISPEALFQLKAKRKNELARPEKAGFWLILTGYIILLYGLLNTANIITSGSFNYPPIGLFLGIFIGKHIARDKRVLPDGEIVYNYTMKDRLHGRIVSLGSIILLIISLAAWLRLSTVVYG